MKPRATTPPAGSVFTVRAKSHDALMSATAKTVAALKAENHSEPVLVVYSDNVASVFVEDTAIAAPVGKAGLPS